MENEVYPKNKVYEKADLNRRLEDLLVGTLGPVKCRNLCGTFLDAFYSRGQLEKAKECVQYIEQLIPHDKGDYISIIYMEQVSKLSSGGVEHDYVSKFIETFRFLTEDIRLLYSDTIEVSGLLFNALMEKKDGSILKDYTNLVKHASNLEGWYGLLVAEDFPRIWLKSSSKCLGCYTRFIRNLPKPKEKWLFLDHDVNDELIRVLPELLIGCVGEEEPDFLVKETREISNIDKNAGYNVVKPMASLALGGADVKSLKSYSSYIKSLLEEPKLRRSASLGELWSPFLAASDNLVGLFLKGEGTKYMDVYIDSLKKISSECGTEECFAAAKNILELFSELTPNQVAEWVSFGIKLSKDDPFFFDSGFSNIVKKLLIEKVSLQDAANCFNAYNKKNKVENEADKDMIVINTPEERQKLKDAREKYKCKGTERIVMHSPQFKHHSTIDLTDLLKEYHGKDLHLAVTKDYSKVVGTGKTMEEAVKAAEEAGYKDIILMRSPDDSLGKRI